MPQTRRECEKLEARPRLHSCDSEAGDPCRPDPGLAFPLGVFFPYEVGDSVFAHTGPDPEHTRTLYTGTDWGLHWVAEAGPRGLIGPDETPGEGRKAPRSCIAGRRALQGGADLGLQPQVGRAALSVPCSPTVGDDHTQCVLPR